jgi:UDP-N-acetylmuramoylalanine--D-glutamate ligase
MGRSSIGKYNYTGRKVVILGGGRQGGALTRYLLAHGADVTLSDLHPAELMTQIEAELASHALQTGTQERLHFVWGGHPISLMEGASALFLSGGVSPAQPIVDAARAAGIEVTNDGCLTLKLAPADVIGITGSAGKTTTTTAVGMILERSGERVLVGGNIGTPLIDRLDQVGSGDKIVLELSSFQLELCDVSPAISAILNITPNHLDRHPSLSHYAAAKTHIIEFQQRGMSCVLNADDNYTGAWLESGMCRIEAGTGQSEITFPIRAERIGFSLVREVAAGAYLRNESVLWRPPGGSEMEICHSSELKLRGRHNLANVMAACCISGAAGASPEAMRQVAATFTGVEHRLQLLGVHRHATWVNDSIATTPERALAALRSFTEPIILLAGGRDKHLPWDEWAAEVSGRVRHVVLFGEAADLIGAALAGYQAGHAASHVSIVHCADLPAAVEKAVELARPGDVVLLSPGGTSFDAYPDFAARGEHFRSLVEALA